MLVAVMGVGLVLSVVAGAATVRTVAAVRAADAAVARERALHAAEAVVTATIDRLDREATGWTDPGGPDPSALGHGWRPLDAALRGLPAPPDGSEVEVRLAVVRTGAGPTVRIRADARVGTYVRSIAAVVRPASTADLAWGTVHAVADPQATGGDHVACALHRWEVPLRPEVTGPREPEDAGPGSDAGSAADCVRTRFDATLRVVGPAHLDDAPRLDAEGSVTGRFTTAAHPPTPGGQVAPVVLTSSDVAVVPGPFGLAAAAQLDLSRDPFATLGDVATCRLRGPTLLRLDGRTVRVTSPRSHPRHDGDGGPIVHCPGLDRTALDGVAVVELPDPAVVTVAADPGARCAEHPLGLDAAEDAVAEQRCGDGTAYVWGAYLGARTVLAEHDVHLVWDVVPGTAVPSDGPGGDDARLGLVAGRSVVVRRPVGPPLRLVAPFGTDAAFAGPGIPPFGAHPLDAPTAAPSRWTSPRIVAAVTALGGALRIQNPHVGQASDVPIRLEGALVQRFMGPTGSERRDTTGALQARTGRPLEVVHDPRLDAAVPPAMPRIRGGRLRVLSWDEVRAEGTPDGG